MDINIFAPFFYYRLLVDLYTVSGIAWKDIVVRAQNKKQAIDAALELAINPCSTMAVEVEQVRKLDRPLGTNICGIRASGFVPFVS